MNSLLEFTELLKNRLTDLLFQEAENDKYIYLYLADGYWTAFEKSAYRLCRIYEPVMLLPMRLPYVPFPFCNGKHQARQTVCCYGRVVLSETFKARTYLFGRERNRQCRIPKMARQSDLCFAELTQRSHDAHE